MVLPPNIAAVLGGAWSLINQTQSFVPFPTLLPSYPTNALLSTYLNGTLRLLGALGAHPVGLLSYHLSGYMSANIRSTDPGAIPSPADSYVTVQAVRESCYCIS
jgi:hypothetical protein